jgi:chromate transporter
MKRTDSPATMPDRSAFDVFRIFLRLGLTSFGGPVAHIGYFRREFVSRRQWLEEGAFADLVALSQFLPGPGSSQIGFALGLSRAGLAGGLAAWLGFTLPSAILLLAAAHFSARLTGPAGTAAIHGLKIVAVAVVAQAVWGMARILTPDLRRAAIAGMAAIIVSLTMGAFGQITAIALGGLAGFAVCRGDAAPRKGHIGFAVSRRLALSSLVAFFAILFVTPLLAGRLHSHALMVFDAFYRSGALVFGGGHVVLPLLRDAVVGPGWISNNEFLAGYGAAQAVPGPLFTVAAYLGSALNSPPNAIAGGLIALIAIFLPGLLILTGALAFWDGFRMKLGAQAVMRGVNAAVVGILAAALYDPLWKTSVAGWTDIALAFAGLLMLTPGKFPPWLVVAAITVSSIGLAVF